MTIQEPLSGRLCHTADGAYVETPDARRHLAGEIIWRGYLEHFDGQAVRARPLPEHDYERDRPIWIIWPDEPLPSEPFVDVYYNERLVKYPASVLGHNAINVDGRIYNFSHLINENEILTHEEYFYRPALGKFAPSPRNGRLEVDENGREYLDKFGRLFMRTIHAVRIFGIDTERLATILDEVIARIHASSRGTDGGEKWRDFNPLTRNCTTLIRDALVSYGFSGIRGRFPRDLYVSCAYQLSHEPGLRVEFVTLNQLKVAEAPYSARTLLLSPIGYWHQTRLPEAVRI